MFYKKITGSNYFGFDVSFFAADVSVADFVLSITTFVVSVVTVVESVFTVVLSPEPLHEATVAPMAITRKNFFMCLYVLFKIMVHSLYPQ